MKRSLALVVLLALAACDDANEALQRMDHQARTEPYAADSSRPEGTTMRAPPSGTVARGSLDDELGKAQREPDRIPARVTRALLERGRDRYGIYCAPCHGLAGDSRTLVADRMTSRRPVAIATRGDLRPGQVYEIIAQGYGLMPSDRYQLSIEDRWAVVAFVRALQVSQGGASLESLPPAVRAEARARLGPGGPR